MCDGMERIRGIPSPRLFSLEGIASYKTVVQKPGHVLVPLLVFMITLLCSLSQTQSDLRDLEILRISVMEDWLVVWKQACMHTKERIRY